MLHSFTAAADVQPKALSLTSVVQSVRTVAALLTVAVASHSAFKACRANSSNKWRAVAAAAAVTLLTSVAGGATKHAAKLLSVTPLAVPAAAFASIVSMVVAHLLAYAA